MTEFYFRLGIINKGILKSINGVYIHSTLLPSLKAQDALQSQSYLPSHVYTLMADSHSAAGHWCRPITTRSHVGSSK